MITADMLPVRDAFTAQLLEDARGAVELYRQTMGRTLEGSRVLDIGAHHGTFSLTALDEGAMTALAVEASLKNFNGLVANAGARIWEGRLRAFHAAAWEGPDSQITLRRTPSMVNTGQYSVAFDPTRYPEAEVVATISFTRLLSLVKRWDYVKVDVEGAEWSWLTGPDAACRALQRFRVLDIELHPLSNTEYYPAQATEPLTLSDVDQWFRDAGCRIVWREEAPTRLFIIAP